MAPHRPTQEVTQVAEKGELLSMGIMVDRRGYAGNSSRGQVLPGRSDRSKADLALIANRQIFPLLTGLEKDDEQIRCFGRFGVSAVNRASPQPLSSTIAGATNDFHR